MTLLDMEFGATTHPSLILRSNLFLESFMMPGLRPNKSDCDTPVSRATHILYEGDKEGGSNGVKLTSPYSVSYPRRSIDMAAPSVIRDSLYKKAMDSNLLMETSLPQRSSCVIVNAALFSLYATENHPCLDPFSFKTMSYVQKEDTPKKQ
jgi:hypothetical protein